jgi:hypothetical protein
MCPLRLVADDRAGPAAVGILVPPLRRTFVIVRPRSLPFDLLVLAEARGVGFREFDRDQAGRAAEALFDALSNWSSTSGRVEESAAADSGGMASAGLHVRVHIGPFHLLACERRPGQPYAPLHFADTESARLAVDRLTDLLCPAAGTEQEFYLNTRNFQR